ncbi:hypothetical protein OsccyDRAFT_3168 [Leptolyngbyaceae cyanobacterium JSC-12]|nr:hypothetical protein OsccyDRAFT_3168 [Leptolyngbyaceae cyanobacterium JSC-12]
MKAQLWLSFLGIILSLLGCSNDSSNTLSQSSAVAPTTGNIQPQEFATPLVQQSARAATTRPVPGLLQPTNAKARTNSIVTGRRDPFAPISSSTVPIVMSSGQKAPNVAPLPTTVAIAPKQPPTIILPPITSTPPVLPLPNLPTSSALPPVGVTSVPVTPPSPTSLAESIEVSGVVQVAGKWSVIVKEPTASSSRHVAVGEYLENGKVLVKKIVSPGSTDPIVVLQQNGVEIRKSLV